LWLVNFNFQYFALESCGFLWTTRSWNSKEFSLKCWLFTFVCFVLYSVFLLSFLSSDFFFKQSIHSIDQLWPPNPIVVWRFLFSSLRLVFVCSWISLLGLVIWVAFTYDSSYFPLFIILLYFSSLVFSLLFFFFLFRLFLLGSTCAILVPELLHLFHYLIPFVCYF